MNHNLTKLICNQISSDKYFTGAFCEFECHCFISKSQEGIQTAEFGSYMQIATVNSVQINVQQYTCMYQCHSTVMETIQYYREFPECQGFKYMHKLDTRPFSLTFPK